MELYHVIHIYLARRCSTLLARPEFNTVANAAQGRAALLRFGATAARLTKRVQRRESTVFVRENARSPTNSVKMYPRL